MRHDPATVSEPPSLQDLGVDVAVEENQKSDRNEAGREKPEPGKINRKLLL